MANEDERARKSLPDEESVDLDKIGHPKGTLAIVLIYAALFALGWAFLYFVEFVPRGAPHP